MASRLNRATRAKLRAAAEGGGEQVPPEKKTEAPAKKTEAPAKKAT